MLVLNNGAFIVLFDPDESRGPNGLLLNPPQLLVLTYDEENDCGRVEKISFRAAKALNREKFEVAMVELMAARRIAHEVADAAALEQELAAED